MPSHKSTIKATRRRRNVGRKTDLSLPIYHDEDAARAHLEGLLKGARGKRLMYRRADDAAA